MPSGNTSTTLSGPGNRLAVRLALVICTLTLPLARSNAAQPDLTRSMVPQTATAPLAVTQAAPPASIPVQTASPAPKSPKKKGADWPKVLPSPNTPPPEAEWTAAEIAAERARCTALFNGSDVVAIPSSPIREDECGAAAPIELVSVGRNPQVSFSPPAVVTCDMAMALSRWMKEVQPVARKLLGAEVSRIEIMSSYSCRNAYGRTSTRLSEHGKANAVDIRGFTTVAGLASHVLDDWGPTGRDIRAQVAAAKASAKKAEAERAAASLRGTQPTETDRQQPAMAARQPAERNTAPARNATNSSDRDAPAVSQGFAPPAISITPREGGGIRIGGDRSETDRSIGLNPPSPIPGPLGRLGGPKPRLDAPGPTLASAPGKEKPGSPDKRTQFHRSIHEIACKMFGTVLGPEANEAHRNHFHLDLAERKRSNFCE